MSKSNKMVSMLLVACLIAVFSLAGCAKNDEKQGGGQSPSSASTENGKELPEVTLSWYYPSGDPLGEEELVWQSVNDILKEKINATIQFYPLSWGDYDNKMKVMMATSEKFDLAFTSNWLNNFQLAASKGNLLPLNELLSKYAPELYASMTDDFWKATTLSGKIYAIPNQQISARSTTLNMPEEYANKYGFDIRAVDKNTFKLEDLEPYLENFKNGEPNKYPILMDWNYLHGYYNFELLGGDNVPGAIYMTDGSLKVLNQFESDEFKSYLTLMKKWVDKGYFKSKELLSKKDQNMVAGQVSGAFFGGTWQPGGEALASQAHGTAIVNTPISELVLNNSGILATLTSISRTSDNPERAMMALELMNTDEQLYNLITYGIEGKHYAKKTGKYIEPDKDSKYVGVPYWLLASTFNGYLLDGQPEDVWAQHKKINEDAVASPALGFTFDPTPVKTEVANTGAVINEYVEGLTYAILSMESDYPVFIEKLKKAGSEKIVEEMQKQIDEWKKTL